jgi:uncharacterized membrane-anchored protein
LLFLQLMTKRNLEYIWEQSQQLNKKERVNTYKTDFFLDQMILSFG